MSIVLTHRHYLVFPDGLVQELEWTPKATLQVGDLIGSEEVGATIAPGAKYMIDRITDEDPGAYPHIRRYHLQAF